MENKKYTALGMMSGSSMDGIDLALCSFWQTDGKWEFEFLATETISFSDHWLQTLKTLPEAGAEELVKQDMLFGAYLGQIAADFLKKNRLHADLIASHGHTLFHRPEEGFTYQLGNGQALAQCSGIKTVSNFRTKDILYGGQGAPLVPIGDLLLFRDFDYCLNLGGIANISIKEDERITGFDICPANQLLNHLSRQVWHDYDDGGRMAEKGKLLPSLYNTLNAIPFYQKRAPKSLGNADVRVDFIRLIDLFDASVEDKLHTTVRHIVHQIKAITGNEMNKEGLITGGGAHNSYLVDLLKTESNMNWIVPDKQIIDFKEAMVFAFMGVLKLRNEINCLSSVTGASRDTASGDVYFR